MAQNLQNCGNISDARQGNDTALSVFYGACQSDNLGLRDEPLALTVSSASVALAGTRNAESLVRGVDFYMHPVRRHLIYHYLLTECLSLSDSHRADIEKHIGEVPELCVSIPSIERKIIVVPALAKQFDYDLSNVPGFYYDYKREPPCQWRLNIPDTMTGIMRPYFEDEYISGIFLFTNARDQRPRLLSSRGLCLGAEAIKPVYDQRGLAA